MSDHAAQRKSRILLVSVALLFALPLTIAWILNFYSVDLRPSGTSNHGQLIDPARALGEIGLTGLDNAPLDVNLLRGKWTLVYIGDPACNSGCQQNLYKMRQVHLVQGKNYDRIQRLMIPSRQISDPAGLVFPKHYPKLLVGFPTAGTGLLDKFKLHDNDEPISQERIYLVDPLGYLMMSYDADAAPKGMIEDLKKLLKASYIG